VKKKLLPFPTLLDSVRHPRRALVNDSGPGVLGTRHIFQLLKFVYKSNRSAREAGKRAVQDNNFILIPEQNERGIWNKQINNRLDEIVMQQIISIAASTSQ
jgi:hypothetical protein